MTGADDYITKPFGVQELMARVNAHVRRERREKHQTKRLISGFMFDFDNKEVWMDDRKLPLTKTNIKSLNFWHSIKQNILTGADLRGSVRLGRRCALFNHYGVYQNHPEKCKEHGADPIKTVWGVGYKWE